MPLYFLSKTMPKTAKTCFLEILVQTVLFVGQFWTIQKITPKSALLPLSNYQQFLYPHLDVKGPVYYLVKQPGQLFET